MKKRIICALVMLCLLCLSAVYINEKPDGKVFDKVQNVSISFLPGAGNNADHLDNVYFYEEDQIRLKADAKYQEFESYEEGTLDLHIYMVKSYERGKLYKLSVDSAEELPEERRNIYFYVTDSKIYRVWSYIEWKGTIISFYDNDLLLTVFLNTDEKLIHNSEIVCQTEDCSSNLETGEPGTHFGIKKTGDQIAYSRCDVKPNGEPGFYEQFVWEDGKGLVYYESGYGAERDLLRLSNISDVGEVSEKTIADLTGEASNYNVVQLEETDFEAVYNGFTIRSDMSVEEIINELGYPDGYQDNNEGNISNGNGFRRWQLRYPNYQDSDLDILFLSKQCVDEKGKEYHGDTYIIGVYLRNVETARGLKVGDTKELVFQQYGYPDAIQASRANNANVEVVYTRGENSIIFTLDETASVIEHIFIDYNMARSVEEQGL